MSPIVASLSVKVNELASKGFFEYNLNQGDQFMALTAEYLAQLNTLKMLEAEDLSVPQKDDSRFRDTTPGHEPLFKPPVWAGSLQNGGSTPYEKHRGGSLKFGR